MALCRLAAVALFLSAPVWCADPPPEFGPDGVVSGNRHVTILVPGAILSIYGQHLASPAGGCCVGLRIPSATKLPACASRSREYDQYLRVPEGTVQRPRPDRGPSGRHAIYLGKADQFQGPYGHARERQRRSPGGQRRSTQPAPAYGDRFRKADSRWPVPPIPRCPYG